MSKVYFVLGATVGVALFLGSIVGATRLKDRGRQQQPEEATDVQLGVMTNEERAHSKLYEFYKDVFGGKTITDAMAEAPGKDIEVTVDVGFGRRNKAETPEAFFGSLTHDSELVIRGNVLRKASQVTENGCFIFTDFKVKVVEVIKNNVDSSLAAGGVITVTRPGGKVRIKGVVVSALDHNDPPLRANGNEVVLFLERVAETGAYKATRSTGVYEIDGESLKPLTGESLPPTVLRDGKAFLATLRSVSNY